jgi:hypothetical protein
LGNRRRFARDDWLLDLHCVDDPSSTTSNDRSSTNSADDTADDGTN